MVVPRKLMTLEPWEIISWRYGVERC